MMTSSNKHIALKLFESAIIIKPLFDRCMVVFKNSHILTIQLLSASDNRNSIKTEMRKRTCHRTFYEVATDLTCSYPKLA